MRDGGNAQRTLTQGMIKKAKPQTAEQELMWAFESMVLWGALEYFLSFFLSSLPFNQNLSNI